VKTYFVYILTNKKNGTLYIGVTNNIEGRIYEHKNKKISGFTKKYSIINLVYYEEIHNINKAIEREKQLKNWKRKWKIDLIENSNPRWLDLSARW